MSPSRLAPISRSVQAVAVIGRAWFDPTLRPLIAEVRRLATDLSPRFERATLPQFLAELTPAQRDLVAADADRLRALVDALAWLDHDSEFGLCMRRSLLRYHFLQRAGLAVGIVFAARMRRPDEGDGVAGHAWMTLDGRPFHEDPADYRGFTILYRWPE